MSAYKTYGSLTSSVKNIISLFGKKYKIIFCIATYKRYTPELAPPKKI